MGNVKVIAAQKEKIDRSNGVIIEKMRVAAYCRVSTDSDEQMNSYASQVEHYKNLINQNPEWVFVDIYAEKENINVLTMNGEMLLTILSSLTQ